jgi:outer membrane protein OmpA-like peptidoglycan-associated protein
MHTKRRALATLAIFLSAGTGLAHAQATAARSTLALTYREGQGSTVLIDGRGALSGQLGRADVKRNSGRTRVKLKLDSLPNPQTLGPLYTTYVLWAVAPEGRAENLAELPHSRSFDVEATTSFASFGLIVTAEPYAGVGLPGPRLVGENVPGPDTEGRVQSGRIDYEPAVERPIDEALRADLSTPLLVLGARRAVQMAEAAGADRFAREDLRDAQVKLAALEQIQGGKKKLSKDSETLARDVIRLAEQARVTASKRADQAALAAERRDARRAVSDAQSDAQRAQADAQRAQSEADRAQADAQSARSAEDAARQSALDEQQRAAQARAEAAAAAEAQRQAREQAEQAQRDAATSQQQAALAQAQAQQALQDKAALQERLYQSISAILETRREARGLIVNLSDVLFDFDQASLKPGAREKLSRLAGILLAYPGHFNIQVEGHTDSVGTHDYNQRLSSGRADSVRNYLSQAGISSAVFTRVAGLGETHPVSSNETASGRQMNRRVEVIISDLDRP